MVLPEVDSYSFVDTSFSLLLDISFDLYLLTDEVPSFDVESFEDHSTIEYILSKDTMGVV